MAWRKREQGRQRFCEGLQEELIQGRKAMRNQYILLSTVCCGLFFGTEAWAQCVATKDCSTLGYKQSSCDSGKGIKCPFGEAWYCPCDASYIYTCTGTNESPSSAKCGDKYSMCNCATGTHWDSSSGSCVADRASCAIGSIYYTDGTCLSAANHQTNKTVLGIVVHTTDNGKHGQIMAPWLIDANGNKSSSGVGMAWGGSSTDISSLPNYTTSSSASTDYDSCGNTDKIVAAGNANTYPAAWAARKYAPTSTTNGKWCLPAVGILRNIQGNQSAISTAVSKVGGASNLLNYWVWSSSERGYGWAWNAVLGSSGLYDGTKGHNNYVLPVLAF